MKPFKVIHCRAHDLEAELNRASEHWMLHILHITNENVENPWITAIMVNKETVEPRRVMPMGAPQFRQ